MSASTGNIRGQRTQSSCNGYKTLASSIASGNNGGCFKRIYANAYQRFNGDSNLALSYTLGINYGDYPHTSSTALTTVKSASYPQLHNYIHAAQVNPPKGATTLSAVHTSSSGMGVTSTTTSNVYTVGGVNSLQYTTVNDNGNLAYIVGLPPDITTPSILNITNNQNVVLNSNIPSNWTINVSGDTYSCQQNKGYCCKTASFSIQKGSAITNLGTINVCKCGQFTTDLPESNSGGGIIYNQPGAIVQIVPPTNNLYPPGIIKGYSPFNVTSEANGFWTFSEFLGFCFKNLVYYSSSADDIANQNSFWIPSSFTFPANIFINIASTEYVYFGPDPDSTSNSNVTITIPTTTFIVNQGNCYTSPNTTITNQSQISGNTIITNSLNPPPPPNPPGPPVTPPHPPSGWYQYTSIFGGGN
jgi:hypothetical protein